MPSLNLPKPLLVFVNAVNAGDANAACVCFTEDATLLQEGQQSLTGRKPIRDWIRATRKKYNRSTKPLGYREDAGESIMTLELAGAEGSPIKLEYRCRINKKDQIEGLRVCP